MVEIIEERIPLKQGLKRKESGAGDCKPWIEERIPLKQGLKLVHISAIMSHNIY